MPKGVKVQIRIGELVESSVISPALYSKLAKLLAERPYSLMRLFEVGVTAVAVAHSTTSGHDEVDGLGIEKHPRAGRK